MDKLIEIPHFISEYTVELVEDIICIKDKDIVGRASVVNNAEKVINEIHDNYPDWVGKEINLLNSDDSVDYLIPDYEAGKVNFKYKKGEEW